jgi:hypothetical protein
MLNYNIRELSINKKYNDDLSMFKYLIGESFVSSEITFYENCASSFTKKNPTLIIDGIRFPLEFKFIKNNNFVSFMKIQCTNYMIEIDYVTDNQGLPHIEQIILVNINMRELCFSNSVGSEYITQLYKSGHPCDLPRSYWYGKSHMVYIKLTKNNFIKSIGQIENENENENKNKNKNKNENKNNFNEIRDYLKSIDDNFLQTYMTIVRHCFNLIGG